MEKNMTEARGEIRIDADKLRNVVRMRGMTLGTVADALGMHYNSILRITHTGGTSFGTFEGLCNVLHCNPLDLLVWDGFPAYDPYAIIRADPSHKDKAIRSRQTANPTV